MIRARDADGRGAAVMPIAFYIALLLLLLLVAVVSGWPATALAELRATRQALSAPLMASASRESSHGDPL